MNFFSLSDLRFDLVIFDDDVFMFFIFEMELDKMNVLFEL